MEKSKIYEKMERIGAQIIRQNGAIISIAKDGESEDMQFQCHAHNLGEIHDMLLRFFISNKELISTALHALSIALDAEFDDSDDDDSDDDDDDDDDEPVDGTPVLLEACMN